MPIRDISILKSYFETGDRPTALQFCDLLDSFIHRTSGLAVSTKRFENNILNIAFSDGTSLEISIPTQDIIDSMLQSIDNLSTGLDTKVDKVEGKGLSSNDYTDEERDKLEGLENYVPPTSETIAFIEGLQDALNQKADDVGLVRSVNSVAPDENGNVELPISNEETGSGIEIRDENDVLQFSADEFIQFEGFSFDPANKKISFPQSQENIYYVHSIEGNDLTGLRGSSSQPYQSIDGVFSNFPHDQQLGSIFVTIVLLNQGTHEINGTAPYINVEFRSTKVANISFTNNTSDTFGTNLFHILNGSQAIMWYFNIPLGSIIDDKTDAITTLNTNDLITYFNVDSIHITSNIGNTRYFGRTVFYQNIKRIRTVAAIGIMLNDSIFVEEVNQLDYVADQPIFDSGNNSIRKRVHIGHYINDDLTLSRLARSSFLTFDRITGGLRFSFTTLPYDLFFNNVPDVAILQTSNWNDIKMSGKIGVLTWNNLSNTGFADLENLIVESWEGLLNIDEGVISFKNCHIKTEGLLMEKRSAGNLFFDNTTIRQNTPSNLIDSSGVDGITINTAGLRTNATSLSNNANDTVESLTAY